MLNTACRARSAVGRVSIPSWETSLTPLWLPASIRIRLSRRLRRLASCGLALGLLAFRRILRCLDTELVLQDLAFDLFDHALLETAELERAVGEADQTADRPAEGAAELADLAVL